MPLVMPRQGKMFVEASSTARSACSKMRPDNNFKQRTSTLKGWAKTPSNKRPSSDMDFFFGIQTAGHTEGIFKPSPAKQFAILISLAKGHSTPTEYLVQAWNPEMQVDSSQAEEYLHCLTIVSSAPEHLISCLPANCRLQRP